MVRERQPRIAVGMVVWGWTAKMEQSSLGPMNFSGGCCYKKIQGSKRRHLSLQEVGFMNWVTAPGRQSQLYRQMGQLKQKGMGRKADRTGAVELDVAGNRTQQAGSLLQVRHSKEGDWYMPED